MPSKPVFLGARLASLPMRTQERSISTEDGMDCVLQEFDDDTGGVLQSLSSAPPISCFLSIVLGLPLCEIISCHAGLIQVWILLLEQLTAAVSNCPRQHQPPTLELLFTLLREVTTVPGDTQRGHMFCQIHTVISPAPLKLLIGSPPSRSRFRHLLCHPAASSCDVTVAAA